MIPKNTSGKSQEEEKKGFERAKSIKVEVYMKAGIVFRAQNYKANIDMDNLNKNNNDYFEIKKHLYEINYKPLDCICDKKNQDLFSI